VRNPIILVADFDAPHGFSSQPLGLDLIEPFIAIAV
jgi:hypothetical protein